MAELIKIDRNGSKYWRGKVKCDRCGGDGIFKWGAVINGIPQYSGVCFKCDGCGWVIDKWIERTPEYQAKLDAKREAKRAAQQAEIDARIAEREAKLRAEEERKEAEWLAREAEKKISQYVGTVGERISIPVEYVGSPYFERKAFGGFSTEICYIHTFKDTSGNKIVWETGCGVELEQGQKVTITGTVKDQSEYKGEKQTRILRCKIAA